MGNKVTTPSFLNHNQDFALGPIHAHWSRWQNSKRASIVDSTFVVKRKATRLDSISCLEEARLTQTAILGVFVYSLVNLHPAKIFFKIFYLA